MQQMHEQTESIDIWGRPQDVADYSIVRAIAYAGGSTRIFLRYASSAALRASTYGGGSILNSWHMLGLPSTGAALPYTSISAISSQDVAQTPSESLHSISPQEIRDEDQQPQAGAKLSAPVKVFAKLLEFWALNPEDGARLLGARDAQYVHDLLRGVTGLRGRDAEDRIRHLFVIHEALDKLFDDVDVEREWLRRPRDDLHNLSPLRLILEGSMENMLLVKQYVERMAGR